MEKTLRFVIYPFSILCFVCITIPPFNAAANVPKEDFTKLEVGANSAKILSEYFGNLTFATQAELDAFSDEFTIINGDVTITGTDITSLAALENITEINGSLSISGNPLLTNIDGLDNLESIVGSFTLDNNTLLDDLGGINHSMFVSINIIITNNPALGICEVEPICFYLANPVASRIGRVLGIQIFGNAAGCEDVDQVLAACTALPVTLVSFEAKKDEQAVLLQWKTAEEVNSANFDIQRSDDGKTWNSIGIVAAAGDTHSETLYSFRDQAPFQGNNLYRLKMIDIDGTFAFSSIQNVLMDANADVSGFTYPNPSTDQINVRVHDWADVKTMQIIDLKGKTVYTSNSQLSDRVQAKSLVPGIYVLRITMRDGTLRTHKLVRQ